MTDCDLFDVSSATTSCTFCLQECLFIAMITTCALHATCTCRSTTKGAYGAVCSFAIQTASFCRATYVKDKYRHYLPFGLNESMSSVRLAGLCRCLSQECMQFAVRALALSSSLHSPYMCQQKCQFLLLLGHNAMHQQPCQHRLQCLPPCLYGHADGTGG